MTGVRRAGWGTALASLLVLGAPAPAAERAGVEEQDCNGFQALFSVAPDRVDPLVPDEPDHPGDFRLKLDPATGHATVSVGAVHCRSVTVSGSTRETRFTTLRVQIEEPDPLEPPDAGYLDAGDEYTVWFVSDNLALVRYFRDHGGVSRHAAVHDPDLVLEVPDEEEPTGTVRLSAPNAPSAFSLTADVEELVLALPHVSVDFWAKVPEGTMVQRPDKLDDVRLGGLRRGSLVPEPGSTLDRVFCSPSRPPGAPVPFSGEAGLTGSSRLFFQHGMFLVGLDTTRQPSDTSRVSCPSE